MPCPYNGIDVHTVAKDTAESAIFSFTALGCRLPRIVVDKFVTFDKVQCPTLGRTVRIDHRIRPDLNSDRVDDQCVPFEVVKTITVLRIHCTRDPPLVRDHFPDDLA
jgi:hypothetical protein